MATMEMLGQFENGQWLVMVDGTTPLHFNTQQEAIAYMSKTATASAVIDCVQTLTVAMDSGPDLWQEHFDKVAQEGDFTDDDLAPLGITLSEYLGCVTLLDALKKFFAAEAVPVDAYRVVVNNVRRVP
jgi:hypothetical protein